MRLACGCETNWFRGTLLTACLRFKWGYKLFDVIHGPGRIPKGTSLWGSKKERV